MNQDDTGLTWKDCSQYKPTQYTYALNLTITSYLEFGLQIIIASIFIVTYIMAVKYLKLHYQLPYQIYYILIILIYICHSIYQIIGWILSYSLDNGRLYFNQKISFYLIEQGDILLTSFFLLVATDKFQEFDEFIQKRLILRVIKLSNIIFSLAQSIWLFIIVFCYNLCKEQIDRYQIFQLICTIGFSLVTILILQIYKKQKKEFVKDLRTLRPLNLFVSLLIFGSTLQIIILILRYKAYDWLINFKYGDERQEIDKRFQELIEFKIQNTIKYAFYDFFAYIFTSCLPLILFVYMYSLIKYTKMFESIIDLIVQ